LFQERIPGILKSLRLYDYIVDSIVKMPDTLDIRPPKLSHPPKVDEPELEKQPQDEPNYSRTKSKKSFRKNKT
jgi:hypothetical protein